MGEVENRIEGQEGRAHAGDRGEGKINHFSSYKVNSQRSETQLDHVSLSSEYTTTSLEFFASYCPCLGFRSWFRAQSWF